VFVSYHHEDEYYRLDFDRRFGTHFISASVNPGDIDPDNEDEYIKRLIQEENIAQASVLFALYGVNTHNRKHVDWEISAALNEKVGGRKGLVVLLLPSFPLSPFGIFGIYDPWLIYSHLHPRTAEVLSSGYADLYFWPGMYAEHTTKIRQVSIPEIIDTAFKNVRPIKGSSTIPPSIQN
jgi:hypothetical protein